MPEFQRTRVIHAQPEAAEQTRLVLEDPDALLDMHVRPGQYCHLRLPGGEDAFFALASTPEERSLTFLIKAAVGPGAQLVALTEGDPVELSPPTGPGFNVEAAEGRDLIFVATGTGIAPIRAVVETVLGRRHDFGDLVLYYGVRNAGYVAFEDALSRWREAGVAVRIHYSRPDAVDEGSGPGPGYVQEMIVADRPNMANAAVFAAGQEELLHDLAHSIADLGGTRDWILKNV